MNFLIFDIKDKLKLFNSFFLNYKSKQKISE